MYFFVITMRNNFSRFVSMSVQFNPASLKYMN